ncbi:hypothetical protein HJG60_012112 [Phyllostomus discolor]|uniref:Uncharacterized protein n=1 Tax=Phyllostomus discolor TaxID=89673 RepID=A0A833ZJG9_9CHIR|nr:hypothetical protein HJG60_012112 [Phyllostomus discolor]
MTEQAPITDAESGGTVSPQPGSLVPLPHSVTFLTTAGPGVKYFHYTSFRERERGRAPSLSLPHTALKSKRADAVPGRHWWDHCFAGLAAAASDGTESTRGSFQAVVNRGLPRWGERQPGERAYQNCCVRCKLYYLLTISRETCHHEITWCLPR